MNSAQINKYPFYFNEYYHWLMYDNTEDYFTLEGPYRRFTNAALSVNSDLSYIIRKKYSISSTSFIIQDVYNNGHHIGGKLNVTSVYSITCDSHKCYNFTYNSDLHQRTVYGNRNNLHDINFRVATLVSKCNRFIFIVSSENQPFR